MYDENIWNMKKDAKKLQECISSIESVFLNYF